MIRASLTYLLLALCLAYTSDLCSQQITLTVSGVDPSQGGNISAGLYSSADGWTKPGSEVLGIAKKVDGRGQVDLVIKDIPAGTYAIAIMHDANSNDQMDTNFIGIPKEGYTFSNSVFGRLGPPAFSDASFEVVAGQTTRVTATMKY